MILSPFKQKLIERSGPFADLENRKRNVLACGAQSLVLDAGKQVLVATMTQVAERIELLHELPVDETLFSKPKIVGINVDVATLIDPANPSKAKKDISKTLTIYYPQLWNKNIIYTLPRYDGTLEDLVTIYYTARTITVLEKMLYRALKLLHDHHLTHNDLSLRNIFYKGKHPDIQFFLGDFGSLSKNVGKVHEQRAQKDLARCKRIIAKAKEVLAHKKSNDAKPSVPFVPSYSRRQRGQVNEDFKRLSISSIEEDSKTSVPKSRSRKIF
ncbi:MAG: hypothetical protein AB7I18_06350 [Candidatus Berkiella sp.]